MCVEAGPEKKLFFGIGRAEHRTRCKSVKSNQACLYENRAGEKKEKKSLCPLICLKKKEKEETKI